MGIGEATGMEYCLDVQSRDVPEASRVIVEPFSSVCVGEGGRRKAVYLRVLLVDLEHRAWSVGHGMKHDRCM